MGRRGISIRINLHSSFADGFDVVRRAGVLQHVFDNRFPPVFCEVFENWDGGVRVAGHSLFDFVGGIVGEVFKCLGGGVWVACYGFFDKKVLCFSQPLQGFWRCVGVDCFFRRFGPFALALEELFELLFFDFES